MKSSASSPTVWFVTLLPPVSSGSTGVSRRTLPITSSSYARLLALAAGEILLTRSHTHTQASLWSIFIVIGTLVFEEGGLRGTDEFGAKYAAYAKEVAPLWPSWYSIQSFLGCPVAPTNGKAKKAIGVTNGAATNDHAASPKRRKAASPK